MINWLVSLDETVSPEDLYDLINCFENDVDPVAFDISEDASLDHIPTALTRTSSFLSNAVFNTHHSESQMMRYIKQLEQGSFPEHFDDFLGSCTMKLNAATEMIPLSWAHWGRIHPLLRSTR